MNDALVALTLVTALGSALSAGALFAFSSFVMRALARLPAAQGVYRSIRGSPNCGKKLLPANQVMAEIRSPSSVSTNNAYGRAMSVCGEGM